MARPADTYRGARRNAAFGRKPRGNTWPRLERQRFRRVRQMTQRKRVDMGRSPA